MAEAVGLVASLVSIIQIAKASIDLYEIISDVRHASDDLHQMLSFIRLERVRFFLWCDYVGITNLILNQERLERHSRPSEVFATQISPVLRQEWTLKVICDALQDIKRNFREAETLLATYTTTRRPSALARLMTSASNFEGDRKLTTLIESDLGPTKAMRDRRKSSLSIGTKLSWGFADRRKFKAFVNNLQKYNDALQHILSGLEMVELRRRNELLATTTSLGSVVADSLAIGDEHQSGLGHQSALERLVEMTARSSRLGQPQGVESSVETFVPGMRISLPSQDLHIVRSDVRLPSSNQSGLVPRVLGEYHDRRVLVEWKYYSQRLGTEEFAYMRQRTAMLVLQLQQSASTDGFSILKCIGHFEDPDYHRIGIMFETPNTATDASMTTLRDRMLADRRSRVVRDLEARMAVSRTLVMTFFRLHSVGWLHKDFRSESVLLFEDQPGSDFELGTPYVCGFDFSRQDKPYELTEKVPTQLRHQYVAQERSLYRHPDLHLQESFEGIEMNVVAREQPRYRKSYDIYSLGVVLLEIGLWHPVKKLVKEQESPKRFHQRLLSALLPELRYRMGKRYCEVVEKCLRSQFGDQDAATILEEGLDDHQARSRLWLESFLKDAVSNLEQISL